MSGQFKGQDIFKFRPVCTHWFASNHTPKTDDTSEGFNRRWLILTFNTVVPPEKRKVDLGDIIATLERESICAWAVLAMPRLLANSEFTLPSSHKQVVREMGQENNSVRFFMEESRKVMVVRDSGKNTPPHISETKLFKEYWSFCLGPGGANPVGSRVFRNSMRELQSSMGFKLVIEDTAIGAQEISYQYLTLVDGKTT
jgi:phage/plasmid-associated DNA primase